MDEHWVNLKHDDITSFGQTRKYGGEGMPHHNVPSDFGDLFIEYRVNFPQKTDKNQRKILENLFDDSEFDLTITETF